MHIKRESSSLKDRTMRKGTGNMVHVIIKEYKGGLYCMDWESRILRVKEIQDRHYHSGAGGGLVTKSCPTLAEGGNRTGFALKAGLHLGPGCGL